MAYIDSLVARRATVAARLAAFTEGAVGDKANTAGGGGANVNHVEYRESLLAELAELDDLIKGAGSVAQAADVVANGPWEVRS